MRSNTKPKAPSAVFEDTPTYSAANAPPTTSSTEESLQETGEKFNFSSVEVIPDERDKADKTSFS